MRDITLADTFYQLFTTRAFATGIPTTLAGSPVVSAYENEGLTQITAGITLGVDHDGVTGLNLLTVVATGANGYEAGKDYGLVITTGTVSSVSVVGEVVAEFSIGRSAAAVDLANATDGLGAIKAETAAIVNDTDLIDDGTSGLAKIATDVAAILVDTAVIGAAGVGLSNITLPATGLDNVLKTSTYALAVADAIWDEILTGGEHNVATSAGRRLRTLQTGGNYEGGMVWIDTVSGTAGTVTDENGTVTLPVSTWADALTLAAAIPLKAFHIANGSTITLSAASDNYVLVGHEWTLVLNSQSIAATAIIDAAVSGTATGADAEFETCIFGTASLVAHQAYNCSYTGTVTFSAAGQYRFINCQSGVPGASAPTFALGTGDMNVEFRRWSGGINFTGIGTGDVITISGEMGTIDLGSATAGTVEVRGTYKAITNGASGVTVNLAGAILGADVAAILVDTAVIGAAGAGLTEAGGDGDHLTAINLPDQTMAITGDITGNLSGSVGSVTGAVGSVTGAVGSVTGAVGSVAGNVDGNVTGSVGSNLELGPAEVNAEVDTALNNTALTATPQGAPSTTPTFEQAVMALYDALVHAVDVTATSKTFKNNAGTVIWKKALSDSGTVYTEAESATGP